MPHIHEQPSSVFVEKHKKTNPFQFQEQARFFVKSVIENNIVR